MTIGTWTLVYFEVNGVPQWMGVLFSIAIVLWLLKTLIEIIGRFIR